MESSINFSVSSTSPAGIKTLWEAKYADTSKRAPLKMAIPHCFGGPGSEASPEDLYLLSLLNCLIATFKVFAEKSKLGYERLDGFANLNLIQKSSGVSYFKNISIKLMYMFNCNASLKIIFSCSILKDNSCFYL